MKNSIVLDTPVPASSETPVTQTRHPRSQHRKSTTPEPWIDYDVSLPASLLPQMRSLVIAQAAAPEPEAAGAPPMARVTVPLPDLSAYPTPRDKAKILLESAAEVEHALMVQYLYAAYSLKSKDQVDAEHESCWTGTMNQGNPGP